MKNYILAIDQGTTGTTVLVIDRQGAVRGRGYAEITQYYPHPGWVEQDVEDIWTQTLLAMRKARENARIDDADYTARFDHALTCDYLALGYRVVRVPVLSPDERLSFVLQTLSQLKLI